jgi:hypothetical protein
VVRVRRLLLQISVGLVILIVAGVLVLAGIFGSPAQTVGATAQPQGTLADRVVRTESRDAERVRLATQAATQAAAVRTTALTKQRRAIATQQGKLAKRQAELRKKRAAAAAKRAELARAQGYQPGTTDPRSIARQILKNKYGYGAEQFTCFNNIIMRESMWQINASNPSSGAYGIPQALPGSKMASVAADWRTNPATQIIWAIGYMNDVYGSPCGAWGFKSGRGWY